MRRKDREVADLEGQLAILGMGSLHKIAAFLPSALSARYSAPAQPMVSPSGFLWQRIRISSAPRRRSTAVCRSTDSVIRLLFSRPRLGAIPSPPLVPAFGKAQLQA
jgi:hypothetical protein